MTRIEYDLLREQMPELKLPTWQELYSSDALRFSSLNNESVLQLKLPCTRDELIAHRMAMMLAGTLPTFGEKGTL